VFNIVDSSIWGKNRKGTRCYISTETVVTRTRYGVTLYTYVRELPCFKSVARDAGFCTGFRSVDLS